MLEKFLTLPSKESHSPRRQAGATTRLEIIMNNTTVPGDQDPHEDEKASDHSPWDDYKLLKPGEAHHYGSATITYRRNQAASDALIKALGRNGLSRSPVTRGWSQLDGAGKADYLANALGIAAGAVTTAASLWGSPSPDNMFSMLISIENKSNHILVPSMIAPMEWAPGRSWAFVKEAPSLMLPGDSSSYEMTTSTVSFWHEPKLVFQVVPADEQFEPITLSLFFRHRKEHIKWRFRLSGIGHATAASRRDAQLLRSEGGALEPDETYSLHCWDIKDSGRFPSLTIASREVDAMQAKSQTSVLSVMII